MTCPARSCSLSAGPHHPPQMATPGSGRTHRLSCGLRRHRRHAARLHRPAAPHLRGGHLPAVRLTPTTRRCRLCQARRGHLHRRGEHRRHTAYRRTIPTPVAAARRPPSWRPLAPDARSRAMECTRSCHQAQHTRWADSCSRPAPRPRRRRRRRPSSSSCTCQSARAPPFSRCSTGRRAPSSPPVGTARGRSTHPRSTRTTRPAASPRTRGAARTAASRRRRRASRRDTRAARAACRCRRTRRAST